MNGKQVLQIVGTLALVVALTLPQMASAQGNGEAGAQLPTQSAPSAGDNANEGVPRHHKKHGGKRRGHGGGGAWSQISSTLSSEQKTQIDSIRTQLKSESAPLREQMKSLKSQLQTNPTGANSEQLKSQLQELRKQMHAQFKSGREKMMAVLTPEQRAQIQQRGHKGGPRGADAASAPGPQQESPAVQ